MEGLLYVVLKSLLCGQVQGYSVRRYSGEYDEDGEGNDPDKLTDDVMNDWKEMEEK